MVGLCFRVVFSTESSTPLKTSCGLLDTDLKVGPSLSRL